MQLKWDRYTTAEVGATVLTSFGFQVVQNHSSRVTVDMDNKWGLCLGEITLFFLVTRWWRKEAVTAHCKYIIFKQLLGNWWGPLDLQWLLINSHKPSIMPLKCNFCSFSHFPSSYHSQFWFHWIEQCELQRDSIGSTPVQMLQAEVSNKKIPATFIHWWNSTNLSTFDFNWWSPSWK